MHALALAALAMVLIVIAPRVMARQTYFRSAPLPALVAWQSVAFAGVLSAVAAAPVAVLEIAPSESEIRPVADVIALTVSGLVLASLLINGHVTGMRLRSARRRHRELIELVGEHAPGTDVDLRVLPHETPTAYCIPGIHGHVVLTEGTLRSLDGAELDAVLAHERAHLAQRHDIVLEFFTVLHQAAPTHIRAPQAIREVRLLIEVLADHAARRIGGDLSLARALVALAGGPTPTATLGVLGDDESAGVDAHPSPTMIRMGLLARPAPPRWLSTVMYGFSAAVLAAPIVLIAFAVLA